jgi:hypothetical protein
VLARLPVPLVAVFNEGTQLPYDTGASEVDKGTTVVVPRNGLISQSGVTKYNNIGRLQVCYIVSAKVTGHGSGIGDD